MAKLALALTAFLAFYSLTSNASPRIQTYQLSETDPAKLRLIGELFDLEHPRRGGFEVDVPESEAGALLALAPDARLVDADVARTIQAKLQRYALTSASSYHSFDQVQGWMHGRATANRDLVTVSDYGLSGRGHPFTVLHLASAQSAGKPAVMLTAATHGDELITTEVLMHLVDKLVDGYGNDARLTKLVDTHDLYIVPVLNADGFTETNRYDGNADPNRSYPYPGHENARPTPSIAAIMKLFAGLDLKGSIDFHAYGELTMYPWAYTHDPIPAADRQRFDAATKRMSELNRYTYGPIADVIYVAPGSSADYYYWKKGSFSLGIELGNDKVPDPSEFPAYFESQEESTWRFLEAI